MKKYTTVILFAALVFASCEKDPATIPNPKNSIYWIGKWNRDSVIVYDINGAVKTRSETVANDGTFTFNADSISGVLTQGGNDYAISWFYDADNNKINISEPDWLNQVYTIQQVDKNNMILTGTKLNRGGDKNERVLYLKRK